jgi:N-acetylglucosamine-6-phosphate deacetylase
MTIKGFVDLQVNGYAGVSFSSTTHSLNDFRRAIQEVFKRSGCIAILVTVITSSWKVYERNLPMLAKICCESSRSSSSRVLGIHLEGPFISSTPGALGCHSKDFVLQPTIERFRRLRELCAGHLKLITMAAELKGAVEVCRDVVKSGISVSLGHQMASESEISKMVNAGAKLATHVTNALPELVNRHRNPIWSLLAHHELYCCIISDGEHVPPSALAAILRAKGVCRTILTSDVSPAAGLEDGEHECFGNRVRVCGHRIRSCDRDGLAGSGALMIDCANHMISVVSKRYDLNLSVSDIEEMTFHAPLRAIGIESSVFLSEFKGKVVSYDPFVGKFKLFNAT